jgi:oligopeptide/dipeptide ABC transporter ATP-binding protein
MLEVRDLSVGVKRGGAYPAAVEHIDFCVYPGEILGIVGESGCGKSLSALSIPGLLPPAARLLGGSAVFEGRDLFSIGEAELRRIRGGEITMVFQEPYASLNPLMRVGKQIAEVLELHGREDRSLNRKRVLEFMEKLDLPEKTAGAYPHQLSGGMCQRVMLALALIGRPKLLIADEPTTALDQHTEAQILALIAGVNREQGTSVLFISHDLSVIRRLCTRVLVMYSGRIAEEGPVEEVFTAPAHEYTRLLLGAVPGRELRGRPLAMIPGRVPAIEERPRGCPFNTRCPRAGEACFRSFPEKRETGRDHYSRCILYPNGKSHD